ncbi:hypothetical protein H9L39_07148 [Fusarium oxysporum f. sp. albedinis]|nr:hypothetical protein H9L39_07148 [Fusarium oxysporum f. sp. albedinis]
MSEPLARSHTCLYSIQYHDLNLYTYVSLSGAAYLRRSHTVPQSLEKRLELEEETDILYVVVSKTDSRDLMRRNIEG